MISRISLVVLLTLALTVPLRSRSSPRCRKSGSIILREAAVPGRCSSPRKAVTTRSMDST